MDCHNNWFDCYWHPQQQGRCRLWCHISHEIQVVGSRLQLQTSPWTPPLQMSPLTISLDMSLSSSRMKMSLHHLSCQQQPLDLPGPLISMPGSFSPCVEPMQVHQTTQWGVSIKEAQCSGATKLEISPMKLTERLASLSNWIHSQEHRNRFKLGGRH